MKPKTVRREGREILPTPRDYTPESVTGFATGTIVLSQEGEMPVEFLSPGDRIISRDTGFATLAHISYSLRLIRAVRFAAGSLGHTRPEQDLILPESQKVLVRDWRAQSLFGVDKALVQASQLIDGEFICDLGLQPMTLYQLHFSQPHVIYAGGLEVAGVCFEGAGFEDGFAHAEAV